MKYSLQKGFTIIETLVAVTVLMIAIAGPLTTAMKAYTAALEARNQTIAMYLAQEKLEEISYNKDVTIQLPLQSNYGQAHLESIFKREVFINPANGIGNESKVVVKVSWPNPKFNNSVSLQEIFTPYQR